MVQNSTAFVMQQSSIPFFTVPFLRLFTIYHVYRNHSIVLWQNQLSTSFFSFASLDSTFSLLSSFFSFLSLQKQGISFTVELFLLSSPFLADLFKWMLSTFETIYLRSFLLQNPIYIWWKNWSGVLDYRSDNIRVLSLALAGFVWERGSWDK